MRPAPSWLAPAQRLIRDIADTFSLNTTLRDDLLTADLTALLQAAHQLEIRLQPLHDSDRTTARREILHLLSPVQGYCGLLQDQVDAFEGHPLKESLRAIDRASQQLLELLHDNDTPTLPLLQSTIEPGRVLLIQPNKTLLAVLTRVLGEDAGHELECASIADLRPTLENFQPDLLILPIDAEVTNDAPLKQVKASTALPVLAIATVNDPRLLGHWLENGADDYLGVPLDPTLLKARVRGALERKRWLDREQQLRHELERNQQFIRRIFGRYLSPDIVDTLLENPDGLDLGGVQRTVTVMMADIRGFTTLCEHTEPDRVVKLLNNYLGTMAEEVQKYRGTIDEFIGDAVLAIFGAPISRYDDTDRALQCALAMQRAVADINRRNRAEGLPAIEIGISLNTGPVVAGNVGSELRSKYAVVGHTVNQTARIEEICSAGSILISAATLRASRHLLCVGSRQQLQARGMLQPIDVYELIAVTPLARDRYCGAESS